MPQYTLMLEDHKLVRGPSAELTLGSHGRQRRGTERRHADPDGVLDHWNAVGGVSLGRRVAGLDG